MNKLYEEQSVIDIAAAIRLKQDESVNKYKISQMDDGVLLLPMGGFHHITIRKQVELLQSFLN